MRCPRCCSRRPRSSCCPSGPSPRPLSSYAEATPSRARRSAPWSDCSASVHSWRTPSRPSPLFVPWDAGEPARGVGIAWATAGLLAVGVLVRASQDPASRGGSRHVPEGQAPGRDPPPQRRLHQRQSRVALVGVVDRRPRHHDLVDPVQHLRGQRHLLGPNLYIGYSKLAADTAAPRQRRSFPVALSSRSTRPADTHLGQDWTGLGRSPARPPYGGGRAEMRADLHRRLRSCTSECPTDRIQDIRVRDPGHWWPIERGHFVSAHISCSRRCCRSLRRRSRSRRGASWCRR